MESWGEKIHIRFLIVWKHDHSDHLCLKRKVCLWKCDKYKNKKSGRNKYLRTAFNQILQIWYLEIKYFIQLLQNYECRFREEVFEMLHYSLNLQKVWHSNHVSGCCGGLCDHQSQGEGNGFRAEVWVWRVSVLLWEVKRSLKNVKGKEIQADCDGRGEERNEMAVI